MSKYSDFVISNSQKEHPMFARMLKEVGGDLDREIQPGYTVNEFARINHIMNNGGDMQEVVEANSRRRAAQGFSGPNEHEVMPGLSLVEFAKMHSMQNMNGDETREMQKAISHDRILRKEAKRAAKPREEVLAAFDVNSIAPADLSILKRSLERVATSGIPKLTSTQSVMEFLFLRSLNRLDVAENSTEDAKNKAILESLIPDHGRCPDSDTFEDPWGGFLCVHGQSEFPVKLNWIRQNICLFGDEPPRWAHRCGLLFSAYRTFVNNSPPRPRRITELRWVFKKPQNACEFAKGAIDYLSEALNSDEIRIPGSDRVHSAVRFFRKSNRKISSVHTASGFNAKNDVYICIWTHKNVVCKTCIFHGSEVGEIKFVEIMKWFKLAVARVEAWTEQFPLTFSPGLMEGGLQKYYDRLMSARLALPDFVSSVETEIRLVGLKDIEKYKKIKFGCDKALAGSLPSESMPSSSSRARRERNKRQVRKKAQQAQKAVADNDDESEEAEQCDDDLASSTIECLEISSSAKNEAVESLISAPSNSNQNISICTSHFDSAPSVSVPLRVWRECRKCGIERPKAGYSNKVWKSCNDDETFQPTCKECRSEVDKKSEQTESTCSPAALTATMTLANAIEEVIRAGFHSTVVEFVAQSTGRALNTSELLQLVMSRQEEECECGVCFFPFGHQHTMLLRPCCRQPMCRICDHRCHFPERPCAFCRSTVGSVTKYAPSACRS